MKQFRTYALLFLLILLMDGCTYNRATKQINNTNIQKITPSKKCKKSHKCEKKGYLQKALDQWLQKEWTPTVEKDSTIQKKYMQEKIIKKDKGEEKVFIEKKSRNFTLQEYVDKISVYMQAKPSDYNSSNTHKLEQLPVIGK